MKIKNSLFEDVLLKEQAEKTEAQTSSMGMGARQLLRAQRTLKKGFSLSGISLFLGEIVSIKALPAPPGSGIRFRRVDLPGKPIIPATLSNAQTPFRFTLLKNKEASVSTVEHILSAFSAAAIDNVLIEIDGPEVPISDGSSRAFVEAIALAGVESQDSEVEIYQVTKPLHVSLGDTQLVALPCDEFKISCLIHYPHCPQIGSQFYIYNGDFDLYSREIAPCRTYSQYEEVFPLIERGLIRGGALETALVFKNGQIMNEGGARFPDEMVRHKVLDLIGDLSLVGMPFKAHIIAIRSGHSANVLLAKEIYKHLEAKSE